MNLKDKLFGVVALTYRIAWVGLILYLIFSKKPLEFILLVLSAGLIIDGTLYTSFRGHEEAKIKIGTSFFTLEIPQFYTGVLIATFVIFAMYYVGMKDKVDKKELKNIINRAVSEFFCEFDLKPVA